MKTRSRSSRVVWDGKKVQALRRHLGLTQREMAEHLGTRQQTISEWETGRYRPRGASSTLLTFVAERARFQYDAGKQPAVPPDARDPARGAVQRQ